MKKMLDWITKHKFLTLCVCILTFTLPLLIVHILFKIEATNNWFAATWSSGELLAYVAGFEALLGTVILGAITVYQSDRANETNERLSKENNFLQKIGIQQLLPLIKVSDLTVENASITTYKYSQREAASVEVSDVSTPDKREIHLRAYLPSVCAAKDGYHKIIKFKLENISESAIRQIAIDRIDFSGFNYKGVHVEQVSCTGKQQSKYIGWLLLPGNFMNIVVDIYFDNEVYKNFWEFDDFTSIGCFDMCLYTTNKSLSDIECKEKIYIEKCVGFKERVMYKAYEGDIDNA